MFFLMMRIKWYFSKMPSVFFAFSKLQNIITHYNGLYFFRILYLRDPEFSLNIFLSYYSHSRKLKNIEECNRKYILDKQSLNKNPFVPNLIFQCPSPIYFSLSYTSISIFFLSYYLKLYSIKWRKLCDLIPGTSSKTFWFQTNNSKKYLPILVFSGPSLKFIPGKICRKLLKSFVKNKLDNIQIALLILQNKISTNLLWKFNK